MYLSSSRLNVLDSSWCRESDYSRFPDRTSYEEEQLDKDPTRLPLFNACIFIAVLEDTIKQLKVLEECNSSMSCLWVMTEMKSLLAHKYGVEEPAVIDDLDDIDPKKLHSLEYNLKKLQRDRDLVRQVLQETYLDLSIERKFENLTQHVNDIEKKYTRLNELIKEESKNNIYCRDVYRQLRQFRNHVKSATYDATTQIERVKSYLEDSELMSECRSRYVSNWQKSLAEQHVQLIFNNETIPFQNIEYFKTKFEQEQRVHNEVEILVNIKIDEIREKIQKWMHKFDKDMEGIDLKIQLKKNDYNQTYEKRLELENTIKKHADLIVKWQAFKEERETIRQYREKMNNAAIVVQSWWRGLLVRQQLGPYKLSKKKGKAKKNK